MNCPNCGKAIKDGLMSKNSLLSQDKVDYINKELNMSSDGYCERCGLGLLNDIAVKNTKPIKIRSSENQKKYNNIIKYIGLIDNELFRIEFEILKSKMPVLTTHTPFGWEYEPITIVTAQNVIGTGIVSEFFSSMTDLAGMKSGAYTNKLTSAEEYCLNVLRQKTLKVGGNAVIATDIDFGEVGGSKGMLMVCAAGTAVKVLNMKNKEEKSEKFINNLHIYKKELESLSKQRDDDEFEAIVDKNEYYKEFLQDNQIPNHLKME